LVKSDGLEEIGKVHHFGKIIPFTKAIGTANAMSVILTKADGLEIALQSLLRSNTALVFNPFI